MAGAGLGQACRAHPIAPELHQPCGSGIPPARPAAACVQLLRPVDAARVLLAAHPYMTDLTQICAW